MSGIGFTGSPTAGIAVAAESAVAVVLTGTVAETVLATVNLPPLGPNDQVEVEALFGFIGAGGTRTPRIKLGATAIAASVFGAANFGALLRNRVANRNATNSQVFFPANSPSSNSGVVEIGTTGVISTSAEQTNAGIALTITGQLAVGTDTIRLESYRVLVFRKG